VKYLNAAEVLPKYLLIEIQKHIRGEVLYIPSGEEHIGWGEKNGYSLEQISHKYGLAYDTVRKILYKK